MKFFMLYPSRQIFTHKGRLGGLTQGLRRPPTEGTAQLGDRAVEPTHERANGVDRASIGPSVHAGQAIRRRQNGQWRVEHRKSPLGEPLRDKRRLRWRAGRRATAVRASRYALECRKLGIEAKQPAAPVHPFAPSPSNSYCIARFTALARARSMG